MDGERECTKTTQRALILQKMQCTHAHNTCFCWISCLFISNFKDGNGSGRGRAGLCLGGPRSNTQKEKNSPPSRKALTRWITAACTRRCKFETHRLARLERLDDFTHGTFVTRAPSVPSILQNLYVYDVLKAKAEGLLHLALGHNDLNGKTTWGTRAHRTLINAVTTPTRNCLTSR